MFWVNLLMFTVACLTLVQCNSYLIKSLYKVSSYLKLNEFTVGFILVAVATSIPEIMIGIMSSLDGKPEFSVGNVIGSNIVDLTLIIGIGAVLARRITVGSKIVKKDIFYMTLIIFAPVVLLLDHHLWNALGLFPDITEGLSRFDGVVLIGIFLTYIYKLITQESRFYRKIDRSTKKDAIKYSFFFIGTLFFIFASANYVVEYAKLISSDLDISPLIIGLFLIAVGTSLPELIFTLKTISSTHQGMALGDIIGSVITNSTLVLGITAVISPVSVSSMVYFTSTMFMLFCAFVFFTYAESESGISWREGVTLILLYVLFIIIETSLKAF